MAYRCDNCGKGSMIGRKHRHKPGVAGGRWMQRAPVTRKAFRPNLHKSKMKMNGISKTMLLCTKCLRELREKFPTWSKTTPTRTQTIAV